MSDTCRAFFVLLLMAAPLGANPIKDDNSIGPRKWKDAIKVYIPRDPEPGRSRQDKIKEAVESWKAKLNGEGTGLNISAVILDAAGNDPATNKPPPTDGGVNVSWVGDKVGEASTVIMGEPTDKMGKDEDGNEIPILKDQTNNGGKVQIKKSVTANPLVDSDVALKTMLHEFGHILGLDHDDSKDSVMQKNLDSYKDLPGPGKSDVDEVKSIYLPSSGSLTPKVDLVPGGFRYAYTATWLAGGDIPLVQIVTPFADVSDFTTPTGWVALPPDSGWPRNIVHFRIEPTDDLTAYLNAANPLLEFSFFSTRPPGETLGWIGDVVTTIGPVPEPSSIVLIATAALLCWANTKKLSCRVRQ